MQPEGKTSPILWGEKRYHTWNYHLRQIFGQKVVKVALNAGLTCPNRDGTVGRGGCVFCGASGAGDCAGNPDQPVTEQFHRVREGLRRKWPQAKYIAYFQAFSNTYGDPDRLYRLFEAALAQDGVVGLAIATRPDCLPPLVLDLLADLNRHTYLWLELGLQTIHDRTLALINRGHDLAAFNRALEKVRSRDIRTCVHIIFGLPGESAADMRATGSAVAGMDIQGVKIHSLYVLQGTVLAKWYAAGHLRLLERETYIDLVVDTLEQLPPSLVIQRLTGEAPAGMLVGPAWTRQKWVVLQGIDRLLTGRNSWQGKHYRPSGSG
ncbi:MAG: TIGR01212 family radical SAM protein [Heliobacteriaceae bacterium]|nr:TIGR01212 family radical SAM protein [Heliobacteriaceae bacterium]MDD4588054.1 TIGR01212 family radical SAM protein [Heliobacteriaceae bacterium]